MINLEKRYESWIPKQTQNGHRKNVEKVPTLCFVLGKRAPGKPKQNQTQSNFYAYMLWLNNRSGFYMIGQVECHQS